MKLATGPPRLPPPLAPPQSLQASVQHEERPHLLVMYMPPVSIFTAALPSPQSPLPPPPPPPPPPLTHTLAHTLTHTHTQVYVFLQQWKRLAPEMAMELLDYQYADIAVRTWAVECLEVLRCGCCTQLTIWGWISTGTHLSIPNTHTHTVMKSF